MANPVRAIGRSGFSGDFDPENEGRRQDRERRVREDEEYYQRTGRRRPPIIEYSPLVDQYPTPDVADDGDAYIENNPSEIVNTTEEIDTVVNANGEIVYTIRSGDRAGLFTTSSHLSDNIPGESPVETRAAFIHQMSEGELKKKQSEEKEFEKLVEESKNNIGNAIEGLDE